MSAALTQARLKELLDYDPETGVFVWKVSRSRKRAGSVAGSKHSAGYINIRIDGPKYLAHRLAWFFTTGKWPREQIDHINCVRADNRFENLRESSPGENARNSLLDARNTSGAKGVSWDATHGRWKAQIMVNGARVYLGYFDHVEDAAAAYADASARLHKDFGRLT